MQRPVWTISADPHGVAGHMGSVVSLARVRVSDLSCFGERKQPKGVAQRKQRGDLAESMNDLSLGPYDIPDKGSGKSRSIELSTAPEEQVIISITSRGVLCVWDTAEERCHGNVPAFGASTAYHPINLYRLDLMKYVDGGAHDSVISVSFQNASSGTSCARAIVKFQSAAVACVNIATCHVEYVYAAWVSRYRFRADSEDSQFRRDSVCRDVGVLPAGSTAHGTEVQHTAGKFCDYANLFHCFFM